MAKPTKHPIARYQNQVTHQQFEIIIELCRFREAGNTMALRTFLFDRNNIGVMAVETKYGLGTDCLRHVLRRFNKVADLVFEFKQTN